LREYQKWKTNVGKELSENDMKEIKEYLNTSPYALKSTVWTDEGNNEKDIMEYHSKNIIINQN
jgi:acyl-CoA reductase-like NAD-dependent aldehyde dehydrogenase